MSVRLGDLVEVLDGLYPPSWAQDWDAVGLVCGDPDALVRRVLLAVDPVGPVVTEAVDGGFDLLLTHHPLYLRGTTTVAADTPKGRSVHRLIAAGSGLFVAHTNADVARPGVSDALADLFDLRDTRPLDPATVDPLDKLVVLVPHADADRVLDALAAAGAGSVGDDDRCAWTTTTRTTTTSTTTGTVRPLPGAQPAVGEAGRVEVVSETRLEVVLARPLRSRVVRALLEVHPYEQPAYDVLELADVPGPHDRAAVTSAADTLSALTSGQRSGLGLIPDPLQIGGCF